MCSSDLSRWDATDQVPLRAVDAGVIGRFDTLDPTTGGDTSRISGSIEWQRTRGRGVTRADRRARAALGVRARRAPGRHAVRREDDRHHGHALRIGTGVNTRRALLLTTTLLAGFVFTACSDSVSHDSATGATGTVEATSTGHPESVSQRAAT